MAVLIWKHGKTRQEVRRLIQARLEAAGISNKVVWDGDSFAASVGWGAVLNLVGEIDDERVVLKKVSGALRSVVVAKSREAFQELFPNGEESLTTGDYPARQESGV